MPIKTTDSRTGELTVSFEGRVVEVSSFRARRNMSDTLDYSDWREVDCTSALVYLGRRVPSDHVGYFYGGAKILHAGDEISVGDRFGRIDCSNHFTWRGAHHQAAEVDALALQDPELAEDLIAWRAHHEETARLDAEKHRAWEEKERLRREQEERDRPVVGKKMIVAKGRKVPVGLVGTVAHVSGSGSVLLKADDVWQDRKANGTWVDARNLRAR